MAVSPTSAGGRDTRKEDSMSEIVHYFKYQPWNTLCGSGGIGEGSTKDKSKVTCKKCIEKFKKKGGQNG